MYSANMTVLQPGTADVSVQMTLANLVRPAYLTFGVDPSATDPAAIGATVGGAIAAAGSLNSVMDPNVTWRAVVVRLGTDGGDPLVGIHNMSLAGGSSTTNSLPPNCAVLVHKRTALGGRRNRGRWYIPWCIGETDVDENGTLTPAKATTIQNACSAFLTALSSSSTPMVVLHSVGKSVVPPATMVTSMTVDPLIATQRRRLGR